MVFSRILLMSTLAFAAVSQDASPMADTSNASIELDGPRARALAVAYAAYREQLPDARPEHYAVHVHAAEGDSIQVVFEPLPAPGEKPTLGGRTAQGRELSVWVKTGDYTVERTAFAR